MWELAPPTAPASACAMVAAMRETYRHVCGRERGGGGRGGDGLLDQAFHLAERGVDTLVLERTVPASGMPGLGETCRRA